MLWVIFAGVIGLAAWSVSRQALKKLKGEGCSGNCGCCAGCPEALLSRIAPPVEENRGQEAKNEN